MKQTLSPLTTRRLTNLKTELGRELAMWDKTSPQYIAISNVIDICNRELEQINNLDKALHIIP